MLCPMSYKFDNIIMMHEHEMSTKSRNSDNLISQWIDLDDMKIITMFVFGLCTTIGIRDCNILPNVNFVKMMVVQKLIESPQWWIG
jgi:hypothetical protein